MRERVGAGADTFEEFQKRRWSEQWREFPKGSFRLKYNYWGKKPYSTVASTNPFFQRIHMAPPAYHKFHVAQWTEWARTHPKKVILIQYQDLVSDYQETMLAIAQFVGSDRTEFEPVTEKVGVWKA
jgi:hypothetical protein